MRTHTKRRRRRRRLFLEPLEDRRLLTTFVVNSTGNERDSFAGDGICDTANNPDADPPIPPSGICTLRAAVDQAGNDPSNDRIEFNIDVPEGVIPRIDRTIVGFNGTLDVDGTTQEAGWVEIFDSNVILGGGGGHSVRGLVLTGGNGSGISIASNNNTVVGNIIGLDPTGTSAAKGFGSAGIDITGSGNLIGGTTAADRNIISGNGVGIRIREIGSNNNVIIGNYIGTDISGTIADPDGVPESGDELGNSDGILITAGNGNRIGGPTDAERNIISGNLDAGVDLNGPFDGTTIVDGTIIQNNYIGVDVSGTVALGNVGRGVEASIASNAVIASNVISANFSGVHLGSDVTGTTIKGNKIGTDATGTVIDPDGTPGNGDEFGNETDGVFLRPFFLDTVTTNNLVGGPDPGDGNIISGNDLGVRFFNGADENTIQGNLIGTDATGTVALPNNKGIEILFSSKTVIAGNTVSGNTTTGIEIGGSTATDNLVAGNRIGVNAKLGPAPPADSPLPNLVGILINDAPDNCIGGVFPVPAGAAANCAFPLGDPVITGNVISGNTQYGVHVANANAAGNRIQGNKIGTDETGELDDSDDTPGNGNELGNGFDGVFLGGGAHDNIVGGISAARRNVISGNLGDGLLITGDPGNPARDNLVVGNFIGTNMAGDKPLPNLFRGVHIDQNAIDNIIGGSGLNRNVISANGADGVIIFGSTTSGNIIRENLIGTDVTGLITDPDGQANTGDELGNADNGIYILDAKDNIIGQNNPPTSFFRNTIAGNVKNGIRIEGVTSTGNVVEGNLIGTDMTGTKKLKNHENGVLIVNAPLNRIGTQTSIAAGSFSYPGNVISGNDDSGIRIEGVQAASNFIGANLIGTAFNGKDQLGNTLHGIEIIDAPQTRIGFSLPGEPPLSGNTISDNFNGIRLDQPQVQETLIGNNFIGTDFEGQTSDPPSFLGNSGAGINIRHGSNNVIGGPYVDGSTTTQVPPNVIGGNFRGVQILEDAAIKNRIQRNSIFDSRQLGIDLLGDGVTPNDDMDGDGDDPNSLPNQLQNFPLLDPVFDEDGMVSGTLNSKPNTLFTIDVYVSSSENDGGFVEGEVWAGQTTTTTNSDGEASFEFQLSSAAIAIGNKITTTATDPDGNTSEFSNPLLLADLRVDLDDVDVGDILRRGTQFVLPYSVTVSNRGTLVAEDAVVRIEGNGQLLTSEPHVITLAACANAPCPSQTFTGEWDLTDLFPLGVLGMPVTLTLAVTADPADEIPEFPIHPNMASVEFVADPRPRIDLIQSEFKTSHIFLNGVKLLNKFDLTVDWNGNLDDSQAGLDQQPVVKVFVNGSEKDSHTVTDLSAKAPVSIDLGKDLVRGANLIHFRADNDLHGFFSEFTDPLQIELANTLDWINTPAWSVTGTETASGYDKTAVYKAGFRFPQLATEGFFGVPVDKVGFAGGDFGPKIPAATLRATLSSDRTGTIEGEVKWEGQVGGKKVGGGSGVGGSLAFSAAGSFTVMGNDWELDEFSVSTEVKAFVVTPKIPFPPPASFIRAQGKLGLDFGATLQVVERDNGELDWFEEAILVLQPSLEAIFSIGEDGIASVEVGVGGTARGEYDLDSDPCLDRSATISPFARLKATFLGFEAQKTFTFVWKAAGCGDSGEGETLIVEPRVFTDFGLIPRYVVGRGAGEAESSSSGLPDIVYPYAKPALARNADGTMTLVYVNEDPTKPDGQHLEIFASRFDGTSWSPPVQLTDDTLLDDAPSVTYTASGQAIATWARLKNPVADPANTDPTTLLGEFEIVYSVYNPTTELWSSPTALTDNAEIDLLPRLQTNAAGETMVVWLRDGGNDTPIFPDDPAALSADHLYATWDGTAWSTPATATTAASTHRAPQFGLDGDNGLLIWSEDTDGNAVTDSDREIRTSLWDGTAWATPTTLAGSGDGIADIAPRVTYDSQGRGNVVWVKAGVPLSEDDNDLADQLFFTELVDGSFSTPVLAVQTAGISDPKLIVDNDDNPIVVWQGTSGSGTDIFFATLDRQSGVWSDPIQFTDDDSVQWWFNPFINDDGELEVLYLEREVGSEPLPGDDGGGEGASGEDPPPMIPTFESSNLATTARPIGADLTVNLLEVADRNPLPGSTVQVSATVVNGGTVTTTPSTLVFFDDGDIIGSPVSLPQLHAGESAVLAVDWTVPPNPLAPHTLLARVDPDNQLAEIDELNNEQSQTTLLPDLVVEVVDTSLSNDTITVTARVANQGSTATTGSFDVELQQDEPLNGTLLGSQTVTGVLAPGAHDVVTFTIDNALATLGQKRIGFVLADNGQVIVEGDETNNHAFGALDPLLRPLIPLPSSGGPFRVRRDGNEVVVTAQDTTEFIRLPLDAIDRLTLPTTDGVNVVIVDYTSGDPLPPFGLFFSGSAGSDLLLLEQGDGRNVTFHGGGGENAISLRSADILLDLTDPTRNLITDVHNIDARGSGANTLTIDRAAIASLSGVANELHVMSNLDDTVQFGDGWTLTGTMVADGVFFRVLEQQGTRLLLNGPANWQNPVDRHDVNNNGIPGDPVGDILSLINEFNRRNILAPDGGLPESPTAPFLPAPYYDVNGDGLLTPVGDILAQINFANSQVDPEGEAEWANPFLPTVTRVGPKQYVPRATVANFKARNNSSPDSPAVFVPSVDTAARSKLDVQVIEDVFGDDPDDLLTWPPELKDVLDHLL